MGGEFADDREESLWTRIGEEYGKYWTATGQKRGTRISLQKRVDEERERLPGWKNSLRISKAMLPRWGSWLRRQAGSRGYGQISRKAKANSKSVRSQLSGCALRLSVLTRFIALGGLAGRRQE